MPIIKINDVGSIGFIGDVPAYDLPEDPLAWSSIRNMGFRAGLAERVQGYAAGFDTTPTEAAYGLFAATQADGTPYVVAATTAKVLTYQKTTEVNVTGSATVLATADTKWTGGLLTGLLVLNESVNPPVFIAVSSLGAGAIAAMTGWPASTTCSVLRPYKYFLVAGNLTESSTNYPYKVRWSSSAVPGALPATWVAATDNDAGSVDLSADDGPIVDMLAFGDQMAIYRESGITMMRYTGGTEVMVFNRVPSASGGGLIGNNCVVDIAGVGHVALSSSDLYVFDGSSTRSILDKRMKRWFLANLTQTNGKRSFLVHHSRNSEVWACFPEQGEAACTKAIIWNYVENTLGVRDIPNATAGINAVVQESALPVWSDSAGAWSAQAGTWADLDVGSTERKTVLASTDNKLYVIGNASDAAGAGITAELERIGISFGDAQRLKYIRAVWPRFDATAGSTLTIKIGTQMAVDEAVSWGDEITYTVGTSRKIDVNKTGRFIAIRVRSVSGGSWRIKSMDVDVTPRGLW